jgi:hypothetical protein
MVSVMVVTIRARSAIVIVATVVMITAIRSAVAATIRAASMVLMLVAAVRLPALVTWAVCPRDA